MTDRQMWMIIAAILWTGASVCFCLAWPSSGAIAALVLGVIAGLTWALSKL